MVTHDSPLRRKALLSARFRQGKGEPGRAGQQSKPRAKHSLSLKTRAAAWPGSSPARSGRKSELGPVGVDPGCAARAENEAGPPCGTASRGRQ
jgi:hypothetical protein